MNAYSRTRRVAAKDLSVFERAVFHSFAQMMSDAAVTGSTEQLGPEARRLLGRLRQYLFARPALAHDVAKMRESDLEFLPPTRHRTTRKVIPCEHLVESLHP